MLTLVFLVFVVFFVISGIFISLEEMKRKDGSPVRPMARNRPVMGRAPSNRTSGFRG
jgi:uncharacterized protein YneF (UPF0154 family)